jgi:hypothetical protein
MIQLMPRKFYDSHQNLLKLLILGSQLKYFNNVESFLFDSSTTVLYSVNLESSLIYNISKNLVIITVFTFNLENQYKFMLNNKFELLSYSKNFEDEYYLNKKILEVYDIKIMDILQLKQEKLYKSFEKTFKIIDEQRLIRKIRTEEYFIPEFYVQNGEKNTGMMNPSHFNISKKIFLSKISNYKNIYENNIDDEKKNFIIGEKTNKHLINNYFFNKGEVIFHDYYNFTLSKNKFIENIAKELAKIPDNDLMFENDKYNYNLIILAKKLFAKLLRHRKNLENYLIRVQIKLSYYYDKPFYFITIDDQKKLFFMTTLILL